MNIKIYLEWAQMLMLLAQENQSLAVACQNCPIVMKPWQLAVQFSWGFSRYDYDLTLK
jgi:hypothetical protein